VVDSTLTGATDVVQYLHVSVYHVKYYLAVQSLALRARSVRAMLSLSDRITEASEASGNDQYILYPYGGFISVTYMI